jgi:transposase
MRDVWLLGGNVKAAQPTCHPSPHQTQYKLPLHQHVGQGRQTRLFGVKLWRYFFFVPYDRQEPDSAPTSPAGRIDSKEMGSRVQRRMPKRLAKGKKRVSEKAAAKRKADFSGFGYADIIEAT